MKGKFREYYRPNNEDLKRLWEGATLVFDSSSLLKLYTYSTKTQEEFLELLLKVKERVWISWQAASEFHRNRASKISKEAKKYEQISKGLRDLSSQFKSSRHPFIDEQVLEEFERVVTSIQKSLGESKKHQDTLLRDDAVGEKVASIFEDARIGDSFSHEELTKIYEEGQSRYEKEIPPGYKDASKPEPHMYGDLIVWKEMLEKAKRDGEDLIFVTDDGKEDWWDIFEGKTLGPRIELIKEFGDLTNQEICFYNSDRFLEMAREYGLDVSEQAIEEIKESNERQAILESHEENQRNGSFDNRSGLKTISMPTLFDEVVERASPSLPDFEKMMGNSSQINNAIASLGRMSDLARAYQSSFPNFEKLAGISSLRSNLDEATDSDFDDIQTMENSDSGQDDPNSDVDPE